MDDSSTPLLKYYFLDRLTFCYYINFMKITFDPVKSEKNAAQRNLPFDLAEEFDWSEAHIIPDSRKDYPEPRFVAVGYFDNRLHVICFTPVDGGIRVISFRKANAREAKKYGEPQTID